MKQLRHLVVACTPITDLRPLIDCTMLESLDLTFTLVEDLGPLMKLPQLHRARLIGNPWSRKSLEETRVLFWTDRDRPLTVTEFSGRADLDLTRKLRAAGLKLSFTHIDGVRPILVKPGFGVFPEADADWASASPVRIELNLTPGITADQLVASLLPEAERTRARPFDVRSRVTLGTCSDAATWIASSDLPSTEQAALHRFVNRFPRFTYFREDRALLDEFMAHADQGVSLPEWLRKLRETFAGPLPHAQIAVQFDAYDGYCIRAKKITESWHTLGLWGYGFDEQRALLEQDAGVYPIGQWVDHWQSTLAISLIDDSDRQIYEFYEPDISDRRSTGRSTREGMLPVFHSYADLFGHVIAIKVDGGPVIRASE
jgi:hypothetical protein